MHREKSLTGLLPVLTGTIDPSKKRCRSLGFKPAGLPLPFGLAVPKIHCESEMAPQPNESEAFSRCSLHRCGIADHPLNTLKTENLDPTVGGEIKRRARVW